MEVVFFGSQGDSFEAVRRGGEVLAILLLKERLGAMLKIAFEGSKAKTMRRELQGLAVGSGGRQGVVLRSSLQARTSGSK